MTSGAHSVILLVEDDPNDVIFIRRGMDGAGVGEHVRLARDGEEAVAYLRGVGPYQDRVRFPLPALVVLDLKLPKRSGLEVLEWIRSQSSFPDLPVVVLTSSREPGDIARAQALGIAGYHVKPVDFKRFTEIVKSIGLQWLALTRPT